MARWRLITIAAAGVALSSVAMGMRARAERSTVAGPTEAATVELAPAVVFAKRPSISEILDLVLRERPSASQLAYAGSGEFPKGSDEAYVAEILSKRNSDKSLVHRITAALVREGKRRNIGSQLLVGVLLTENPWLDPRATSSVGARGLMQVMPFHAGKWGCGSADLFDIDSNICHGVAVLSDNLDHSRSLRQALKGYNGCVRGTNTPDCWKYPAAVYKRGSLGK